MLFLYREPFEFHYYVSSGDVLAEHEASCSFFDSVDVSTNYLGACGIQYRYSIVYLIRALALASS